MVFLDLLSFLAQITLLCDRTLAKLKLGVGPSTLHYGEEDQKLNPAGGLTLHPHLLFGNT